MKLLIQMLCLLQAFCYVILHDPDNAKPPHVDPEASLDRCDGIEFDAIAVSEEGFPLFFKGDHFWTGFSGCPQLINSSFPDLDETHHHVDHVDAAFYMHPEEGSGHHAHLYFFLDHKAFSYCNHTLGKEYPKDIAEAFPGVPHHLDAAIGCPKSECGTNSAIFFKEGDVYHYDIEAKKVEKKDWPQLPHCTSALRWNGHYYCFHGHNFTRFHPVTGVVTGNYPKDTRGYFMRCDKFENSTDPVEREKCSYAHVDAVTADKDGNLYAFRAHSYFHHDKEDEVDTIEHGFKELHGDVDAAFSKEDTLFIIKDNLVYAYKEEKGHPLVEEYPKPLKDVLGIEGHVDATFLCGDEGTVYVIQGKAMRQVDLSKSPPAVGEEVPLPFADVMDAALCDPKGVKVLFGAHFYEFESPMVMAASKMRPEPHRISKEMLGCDH